MIGGTDIIIPAASLEHCTPWLRSTGPTPDLRMP